MINLDATNESQVFVTTQAVRNSDHANGTIQAGERVFFRQSDEGTVYLLHESGEPTNGSEYAEFPSVAEAEAFARRAGLVEA
jgi:hypothetical protein